MSFEITAQETESHTVVTVRDDRMERARRYTCPKGTHVFDDISWIDTKCDRASLVTFSRRMGDAPPRFLVMTFHSSVSDVVLSLLPHIQSTWGLTEEDVNAAFVGAALCQVGSEWLATFGNVLLSRANLPSLVGSSPASTCPNAELTYEDIPYEAPGNTHGGR